MAIHFLKPEQSLKYKEYHMLFQTNINHAYYAIGQSESVSKFIIVEQFDLL